MILLGETSAEIFRGALGATTALVNDGPMYQAEIAATMPTDKVTYQDGTIVIKSANGTVIYSAPARFRGRGNSTWEAPKKPFKVRSLDRLQRPFGFSASRDWALMADYYDQSHIRTQVAYEVARRATGRWAPLSRPVRVIWNGAYQGLYRFSETADVQVGRVDIRSMSSGDTSGNALTGPYYLEMSPEEPTFSTALTTPIKMDTPDGGVAQQQAYIAAWLDVFETALVSGTESEILSMIDLPSWVDWYLVSEGCKNMDSDWQKSCKFYKDQDAPAGTGKVVLWPPWDYDLTLGQVWQNGEQPSSISSDGWITRTGPNGGESTHPSWIYYVWQKSPTFREAVREAWTDRFRPTLLGIGPYLYARHAEIEPFVAEDLAKWPRIDAPNAQSQPEWIMDWIEDRVAWIDANL